MGRLENLLYWDLQRWGYTPHTELAEGMEYYWLERSPREPSERRRPPIVLLHGIAANLAHWHDVALYLRWWGEDRVYILDLPGHGRSSIPEAPLTPDALQRLVESWIDRTIGTEPFVLVGNSLGGSVTLRYALEHPERLAGLVAISPAVGIENEAQWADLCKVFAIRTRADASEFLSRLIPRLPWYIGILRPFLVSTVLQVMQDRGVRDLISNASVESFHAGAEVPTLKMPMLAVWGGMERVLSEHSRDWLRKHWPPHGEWWAPERAGHCPQIDYAKPLARKIREFVDGIRA